MYWTAFWASLILLFVGFRIVSNLTGPIFSGDKLAGYGGVLVFPFMILSGLSARQVCRFFGTSQDSRTVEIIERGAKITQSESLREYELRFPRSELRGLAWLITICSLICFVAVIVLPAVPGTKPSGFFLAGTFGVAAIGCWLAYLYNLGFIARVDAHGIKGYSANFGVKVRSIPWEVIESCEVTTVHNVMGQLSHPFFRFKDKDGKVLLKMATLNPGEQTSRFKIAIEHYLSQARQTS